MHGAQLAQPTPQRQIVDPGLAAVAIIAAHYRIGADPYQMAHDLGIGAREAAPAEVVRAAKRCGLKSRLIVLPNSSRLETIPIPAILPLTDGGYAILVARLSNGCLRLLDPIRQIVREETL